MIVPCRQKKRRGFALISTVMLIGIAGLLLVSFSRLSVSKSLQVIRETQELQKSWAAASAERLVFGGIQSLLVDEQSDSESGETTVRAIGQSLQTLDLGEIRLEILIADESSKLDLNFVAAMRGEAGIHKSVRKMSSEAASRIHLIPKIRRRDSKDNDFVSWDQVFENTDGSPMHPDQLIRLTQQVTCWGKKICLGSASDEALREVCELTVGKALSHSVVEMREKFPGLSVSEFMTRLALPAQQSSRLARVLADRSISQSIWLKAVHQRSGSRSYWLVIREGFIVDRGSRTDTFRYQAFQW